MKPTNSLSASRYQIVWKLMDKKMTWYMRKWDSFTQKSQTTIMIMTESSLQCQAKRTRVAAHLLNFSPFSLNEKLYLVYFDAFINSVVFDANAFCISHVCSMALLMPPPPSPLYRRSHSERRLSSRRENNCKHDDVSLIILVDIELWTHVMT